MAPALSVLPGAGPAGGTATWPLPNPAKSLSPGADAADGGAVTVSPARASWFTGAAAAPSCAVEAAEPWSPRKPASFAGPAA